MDERLENIKKTLKEHNQEHLLLKYDELNDEQKEELLNQIESIDFDLMERLYEKAKKPVNHDNDVIEPIDYVDKSKLTSSEKANYEKRGIEAIKYNKLAVVTMAGGQGTRLGHTGPKGTFDFGLKDHKSIFEALAEIFKDAWRKYDTVIPWYIMTSKQNNEQTIQFFEDNNYFWYPKDAIHFFIQGELPMVGVDGKILLDENGEVKMAANGHGGTLKSMEDSGVLAEMQVDGIEWIFISGVDNILVIPFDPLLIGMAIQHNVLS